MGNENLVDLRVQMIVQLSKRTEMLLQIRILKISIGRKINGNAQKKVFDAVTARKLLLTSTTELH